MRRIRLMVQARFPLTFMLIAPLIASAVHPVSQTVGPDGRGGYMVSTLQTVKPAGEIVSFPGRPVDLALDSTHHRLFVKEAQHLIVIDTNKNNIMQSLAYPSGSGASMHGIVVSANGDRVWVSTAGNEVLEAEVDAAGQSRWARNIMVPGLKGKGPADGCGMALFATGTRLAVCLSIANELALIDLKAGKVDKVVPVGVAPYDVVVSSDGSTAYVSDWGGRQPDGSADSSPSAGTHTRVDARGVANDGCVSVVDLNTLRETGRVLTGLHPAGMALSTDGAALYTANANSDTVTSIDTATKTVSETIPVHIDPRVLFGSAPNAVCLSSDGRRLYAANGGDNCLAVIELRNGRDRQSRAVGCIATGWYPGAVLCSGNQLYTAAVKGLGAREPAGDGSKWNVKQTLGCVSIVSMPDNRVLRQYTAQSAQNGRLRLTAGPDSIADVPIGAARPVPLPDRRGDPSVFKHVVYILKENRSYDQLFGDIKSGNGDPRLVMYGEDVTPNHHAMATQFVLLDNYYCNGTISADGHSWATEGNCTDHLEKSFGGFVRSYTFGDDPLTYSSSGFLWDRVLEAGRTFRNYGEMDYAEPIPKSASFKEIYADFVSGAKRIQFTHSIGIENLKRHTAPNYPGWNLGIPDVIRADIFLKDLNRVVPIDPIDPSGAANALADLTLIYLPDDHTSGTSPGAPTPRAQLADNDLALGRIVEGITHSRYWPETCIFVNEDDPQDGYDHVDGHRSICLLVSPYTRRHVTVSAPYNQTSALHTMERILGLRPMNQFDAGSPTMDACFTLKRDASPYTCLPNRVPLDEMNPPATKLTGLQRTYARKSARMNWTKPDAADDDLLNRILWYDEHICCSIRGKAGVK